MNQSIDVFVGGVLICLLAAAALFLFPASNNRQRSSRFWLALPVSMVARLGFRLDQIYRLVSIWKLCVIVLMGAILATSFVSINTVLLAALAAFFAPELAGILRYNSRRSDLAASVLPMVQKQRFRLAAGMSLARCMEKICDRPSGSGSRALAQEIETLNIQLKNGVQWQQAFDALNERTGVNPLYEWSMIMKSGRDNRELLVTALDNFSIKLMAERENEIKRQASRLSVWSMLPMLLISVPMFVVLVFFPAGVKILEVGNLMKDLF